MTLGARDRAPVPLVKRGPGRPPKPAVERATVEVKLRLTVAQWRLLRAWAASKGRPLATSCVSACLRAAVDYAFAAERALDSAEYTRPT